MVWQEPEGMDEYLKPTELCDCDDTKLKEKAKELIKGAETPKEAALRVFCFVRDETLFGMGYPEAKASRTLRKGIGFCWTKTNLQTALLRAVGIPARCHYVHLPKELLQDATPGFMYDRMPPVIGHPWCECYLSDKWIACEALLDEALYRADLRKRRFTEEQIPTIDWDGATDLILFKPWIVEDLGTFPALDDVMMEAGKRGESVPPRNKLLGWFVFSLANRRISKTREG